MLALVLILFVYLIIYSKVFYHTHSLTHPIIQRRDKMREMEGGILRVKDSWLDWKGKGWGEREREGGRERERESPDIYSLPILLM